MSSTPTGGGNRNVSMRLLRPRRHMRIHQQSAGSCLARRPARGLLPCRGHGWPPVRETGCYLFRVSVCPIGSTVRPADGRRIMILVGKIERADPGFRCLVCGRRFENEDDALTHLKHDCSADVKSQTRICLLCGSPMTPDGGVIGLGNAIVWKCSCEGCDNADGEGFWRVGGRK